MIEYGMAQLDSALRHGLTTLDKTRQRRAWQDVSAHCIAWRGAATQDKEPRYEGDRRDRVRHGRAKRDMTTFGPVRQCNARVFIPDKKGITAGHRATGPVAIRLGTFRHSKTTLGKETK